MLNYRHRLALGIVAAAFLAVPIAVHAESAPANAATQQLAQTSSSMSQTGERDDANMQSDDSATNQSDDGDKSQSDHIASNQSDENASNQSDDGDKSQHNDE